MIGIQKVTVIVAVVTAATASSNSLAQTSEQFASESKMAWSAFRCHAFAVQSKAGEAEVQRLFSLGYGKIKSFLTALRSGAITRDDASKYVPVGVLMLSAGPSDDFIAGRIFEGAVSDARKEMLANDGDADLMTSRAKSLYSDENCDLLGR